MNAIKQPDVHPDVVFPAAWRVQEALEGYPSKKVAYNFADLLAISNFIFEGYSTGYEDGIVALTALHSVCQKSSPRLFGEWRTDVERQLRSAQMQHRDIMHRDVEKIAQFVHYNPGLLIANSRYKMPYAEIDSIRTVVGEQPRNVETLAFFSGSVMVGKNSNLELVCDTSRLSALSIQRHVEQELAEA